MTLLAFSEMNPAASTISSFVPSVGTIFKRRTAFDGGRCVHSRRQHKVQPTAVPLLQASSQRPQEASDSGDERATWRDELGMLLDPKLSLSAKSVLLQDMSKRAPEIGKEAFEDVCSSAGLDGVPAVVQQITDDIVPDIVANGSQYVTEIGKRVPDVISDAVDTVQTGGPMGGASAGAGEDIIAALGLEVRNMFNRTPEGLETPDYEVIAKYDGYQLRRYSKILVAETSVEQSPNSSTSEVEAASSIASSFNILAKYLFGKNTSGAPMAMTTPVVIDYSEREASRMSFILPSKYASDAATAPQPISPVSDAVSVSERPGGVYAVIEFSGLATAGEIGRQLRRLTDALARDGTSVPDGSEYAVLIYNGPGTVAFRRRNELCLRLNVGDDDGASFADGEGVSASQSFSTVRSEDEIGFVDISGTTD